MSKATEDVEKFEDEALLAHRDPKTGQIGLVGTLPRDGEAAYQTLRKQLSDPLPPGLGVHTMPSEPGYHVWQGTISRRVWYPPEPVPDDANKYLPEWDGQWRPAINADLMRFQVDGGWEDDGD